MDQQGIAATKRTPGKPRKKKTVLASTKDLPTLQAAHQAKEMGKQTHLQAPRTRETYSQHLNQARTWLKSHFKEVRNLSIPSHPESVEGSEIYHDPAFKDAFEWHPNHCSNEALSIYLGWRGFKEKCSQSTVDGI